MKDRFDPNGLFNPGKIVRAPKFDDRSLFRYGPDYRADEMKTHLDWSAYPGGAAVSRARSRCATTTAPAARSPAASMCPSYRVTRDERDVTRGRANTLRLAITGQLGPDALASDEMAETLKLLRLLQGLPARMPDRRRHGAHEDRSAGGARRQSAAVAA